MAILNEEIGKIEAGSALDKLYNRLLEGFNKAQEDKLIDYTSSEYVTTQKDENGVVTYIANEEKIKASVEEQKGITIKNSAYLLASSIVGNNGSGSGGTGGGGSEGIFVSVSGDSMTGKLNALYGFSAGDKGEKILDVYQTNGTSEGEKKNIVKINGELHLDSYGLFVNDKNVLSYYNDLLKLSAPNIQLDGKVTCTDSLTIGNVTINQGGIHIDTEGGSFEFYHSGNSNKEDVDWTMKDGTVAGNLLVKGNSNFQGGITALGGVSLGGNGKQLLSITDNLTANIHANLSVDGSFVMSGCDVFSWKNEDILSLSVPEKILNFGDNNTKKINLQTGIYDDDGEYQLVSKFGDAYFPNSFKAGHFLGNVLIETYKNDTDDSGVLFSRWVKFYDIFGPGIYSDGTKLEIKAPFRYIENPEDGQTTEYRTSSVQFEESTSLFKPLNKKSSSFSFKTDADFYVFDKPIEGKKSIGIANSKTRLLDKQLFFDDTIYWQGITDGVKLYGNVYMVGDVGSVEFSSGFAGNGWQIYKNQLTGNISATFDELTVRKKMRIYELEVQKQSVTNGSLWVSDACSGDIVEEVV